MVFLISIIAGAALQTVTCQGLRNRRTADAEVDGDEPKCHNDNWEYDAETELCTPGAGTYTLTCDETGMDLSVHSSLIYNDAAHHAKSPFHYGYTDGNGEVVKCSGEFAEENFKTSVAFDSACASLTQADGKISLSMSVWSDDASLVTWSEDKMLILNIDDSVHWSLSCDWDDVVELDAAELGITAAKEHEGSDEAPEASELSKDWFSTTMLDAEGVEVTKFELNAPITVQFGIAEDTLDLFVAVFDFFVHGCHALSDGEDPFPFITNGCGVDIVHASYGSTLSTGNPPSQSITFNAFAFKNENALNMQCSVRVCVKGTEACKPADECDEGYSPFTDSE